MADAGDIKARALLDNVDFMGALGQMVNATQSAAQQANDNFNKMGDAVGKVVSAVGAFGALAGLTKFAENALDAAGKAGKLESAFRNLNGATDETEALLKNLEGMEFSTMFDFEDTLGPAAKHMLELGVSADQAGPAMKALADAATGMKEGPEYINRVSDSLATMNAHVMANNRDIKALQKDGAFSWTALTDVIGGTTEQAMAKVKAGLVSAQDVTTSVTNYLETRWNGQAESVMGGWKGAMHVLSETTEEAQKSIGESIKGVLTDLAPVMRAVTAAISEMVELWNKMPAGLREGIVIFAAVAAAVVATTSAVALLGTAWKLLSAALTDNVWGLAIAVGVAVLVTLSTWVAQHWGGVKSALQWIADFLTLKFPSGSIADAFKAGQKGAEDQAAAEAKLKKQHDETGASAAESAKATREQEAADIKAAKEATDHAAAVKKQAEETKKATEIQKQYVADVNKGYDALKAASPEAAAAYARAMGDIKSETDKVAAIFGTAWPKMSDAQKQLAVDTFALSDAFKALGVTSESSLTDSIGKAEAAYQKLNDAGTTTAADMVAANDKVIASVKTLADAQNKDLKQAYDAGAIAASDYYAMVETRAADALAASLTANKGTVAGDEDVFAHRQLLADATKALNDQAEKDAEALANSVGQKTVKQLNDATAAAGALAAAYDLLTPAGQKAADAFKALGVTTLDSQLKSVNDLAASLAKAQANSNGMISDQIALADGAGKLDDAIKGVVTTLEKPYQQAIKDGSKTQQDATNAAIQGLKDLISQWKSTGDDSTAQQNRIAAAQRALDTLVKQEGVDAAKQLKDAYHDFGLKTQEEYDAIVTKANNDYATLVADGSASATQLKEARIGILNAEYTAQQQMGTDLSEAQKNEYSRQETDLKNHLDTTKSQWDTAYGGIHDAVSGMFDSLAKKLVTGDGSFHDIITGLWQGIAQSCLDAFIQPVTKAIENFIATTLTNLLTGKGGLSDVLDGFKSIGKAATDVFSGASSAASGAAASGIEGDIGIGSLPLPGGNPLGGISAGLPGAASGAASGASAAVSGAMGMVNMVTGIVGAVGSIATAVGTFVEGAQMNTALNKIEESTRQTALLTGMQGDGGIHQKIAEIRDSLSGGGHVWWELDAIRDNLNNHLEPIRNNTDTISAATLDISGATFDIRVAVLDMSATIRDVSDSLKSYAATTASAGAQSLTVNVSPQGLTTKEAARALGDQIAANVSYQLGGGLILG